MTTPGRQIPDDERKYYYLEDYLFSEVHCRFHEQKCLLAEDFFCIVIWKSNRSKSYVARRLLSIGEKPTSGEEPDLNQVVKCLTTELFNRDTPEARLCYLLRSWEFLLPMASAILTVLYPEEFTVYDRRVCELLRIPYDLANRTKCESVWPGYKEFMDRVKEELPGEPCLREKDRWLWGKSFHEQLKCDINRKFIKDSPATI